MSESLWHYYWQGWRKTFVYRECASRREFWSFILGNLLVLFIIAAVSFCWMALLGGMAMVWIFYILMPLSGIASLVLFLPVLSLGIRRMHDIGYSGWWFGGVVLISQLVIPLILLLFQTTEDGTAPVLIQNIYSVVNILSAIILVWLCCKPGKGKEPTLSATIMK